MASKHRIEFLFRICTFYDEFILASITIAG